MGAFIASRKQDSDQAFAQEAETYVNIAENTVDFLIFANLITGYDQLAKNVLYCPVENGALPVLFCSLGYGSDLRVHASDPDFPWGTKYELTCMLKIISGGEPATG